MNKHRAYAFHRPSALWIAQIVVDMTFGAAQIMMFSLIVYWMCGLVRDAGAFFTFYLLITAGYLAMTVRALFIVTVAILLLQNVRPSKTRQSDFSSAVVI